MANVHQTKSLLIAELRRILELLHTEDILKRELPTEINGQVYYSLNRDRVELNRKLREFRRDSIRFERELHEAAEAEMQRRWEAKQKSTLRQQDA